MAKWPQRAHERWKRLGTLEKIAVAGKADFDSRGCEMPVCMPDQYLKQGYKVAQRSSYQIWLVHPSGRWRYLFGDPTTKPQGGRGGRAADRGAAGGGRPAAGRLAAHGRAPDRLLGAEAVTARALTHPGIRRARSRAVAGAAPAAPLAARVLALQRTAGNRATAHVVALMRTPKEISVDRQDLPHTWTARFSAELSTTELTLTIRARIEPDRDVTDAQVNAVEKQAVAEFNRIWDSKFVVSEDGGKTERVVRVKLEFVAKKPHVSIQLRQGAKEDNRRIWFVSSPAITRAHELGHQLGLSDEKLDPAFENRKTVKSPGVFQDNSIMGDYPKEGADKATAKLRHGQSILAEVGKVFGKTFTVRMNVKP